MGKASPGMGEIDHSERIKKKKRKREGKKKLKFIKKISM